MAAREVYDHNTIVQAAKAALPQVLSDLQNNNLSSIEAFLRKYFSLESGQAIANVEIPQINKLNNWRANAAIWFQALASADEVISSRSSVPDSSVMEIPAPEEKVNPLNNPGPDAAITVSESAESLPSTIFSTKTFDLIMQNRQRALERRAQAIADAARVREAKAADIAAAAPVLAVAQDQKQKAASKPYDWKKKALYLMKRNRQREWTMANRIDAVQKYARRRKYRRPYRKNVPKYKYKYKAKRVKKNYYKTKYKRRRRY